MSVNSRQLSVSRLKVLKWAGIALFGLIVVRVGYLKVARADGYAQITDDANRSANRPDPPEPGTIYDAAGNRIAYSDHDYLVAVAPNDFKVNAKQSKEPDAPPKATPEQAAQEIAEIIGIPAAGVLSAIRRKGSWAPVAYHVPPHLVASLRSLCKDYRLAGLELQPTFVRRYPYHKVGCYVAGRRRSDHTAASGLELNYRFLLDGIPGTPPTNIDPYGRLIVGQEDTPVLPPVPGKNIMLTVDMELQQAVEAALDECMEVNKPTTATCTVFDVRTGAIKALASRPNCDPTAPGTGIGDKPTPAKFTPAPVANTTPKPSQEAPKPHVRDDYEALPALRPFEPGSTFKILTAAAAIEYGVADEHTGFHCCGREMIGGKPLKCAYPYDVSGHGDLDLPGMLAKSCNLFAAHLAMKMGPERFVAFLKNCGIGEPAQSGFPFEPPGILHPASAIRTPKAYYIRDLANMGFGQNVEVTDLQLLAATSAILDGGVLVQPHIVSRIFDSTGGIFRTVGQQSLRRVCSESTSKRMRKMLRFAVETGTGKPARIPGVAVGGKTGTAQKWVEKEEPDPSHPGAKKYTRVLDGFIMSFILFLPVDACPRYAILVTAEDPKQGEHGSDVAAPVARKVAVELCRSTGMLTAEQLAKLNSAASPK